MAPDTIPNPMRTPSFYSHANDAHPMEQDCNASDPLPVNVEPAQRISCTLAQNDLLRRVIAWLIYRHDLPCKIMLGKFELDHAPVETLIVKQDDVGNAFISINTSEIGS